MSWDVIRITRPIARKEYHCEASDWLAAAEYREHEFSPEDWQTIQKAEEEGFVIKRGTRYINVRGLWEGDFQTVRKREDIDLICRKYDLYPE